MRRLRSALAESGRQTGLSVIAAGTHPTANWPDSSRRTKQRYDDVVGELQIMALRNLVCGLQAHVELPDDRRVDVMRRAIPFLPILLGLSCSPFVARHATGFSSYRMTSYDERRAPAFRRCLPRRRIPAYVDVLKRAKVIPDASYIWWRSGPRIAIRRWSCESRMPARRSRMRSPSRRSIAADAPARHRPQVNAKLGPSERALAKENKWRAAALRFARAPDRSFGRERVRGFPLAGAAAGRSAPPARRGARLRRRGGACRPYPEAGNERRPAARDLRTGDVAGTCAEGCAR